MTSTDNDGWNVVSEESPIRVIFDTIGDEFIGTYEGDQMLTSQEGDEFANHLFRGTDGRLYGIYTSYKLAKGLEGVKAGQVVRIEYVKDVPTKKQPMKDYRISVKS